jgi:hypothetical protein
MESCAVDDVGEKRIAVDLHPLQDADIAHHKAILLDPLH